MPRTPGRSAAALIVVFLAGAPASGAERLSRQISDIPGMPSGISAVAQDTTGYLWLASGEGLARFDGYEIRPWGPEVFNGVLEYVSAGPGDRVLGGFVLTGLLEVSENTLHRIRPPGGTKERGARHAVYSSDGRLWAAWDGRLFRMDREEWREIDEPAIAADYAWRLAPREAGGVLVGTDGGTLWAVSAEGRAVRVAKDLRGRVSQVLDAPLGALVAVRGPEAGLFRVRPEGIERLLRTDARPTGLARRGRDVWSSHDDGMRVVRENGTSEFLSEREGFFGAGSLAVDREAGLWVTSARGLRHYPEPDAPVFTSSSGLPSGLIRSVHSLAGSILATSWSGPLMLKSAEFTWIAALPRNLSSLDRGCADPWGGVWLFALKERRRPALANVRDDGVHVWPLPSSGVSDLQCTAAPDGSFWIWSGRWLFRVAGPGAAPALVGSGPPLAGAPGGLTIRRARRSLAVATFSGDVCEATLPSVGTASIEAGAWSCAQIPGASEVLGIVETQAGRLWVGARGGGLFAGDEGRWQLVRLAGAPELESVVAITPSPSGGCWVLGRSGLVRIGEGPAGPVLFERLTTAHGIPAWTRAHGLVEQADGTIWLALLPGIVKVPPESRRRAIAAPGVTLTSLIADGHPVRPGTPLTLRHGEHWLEARWAALSFRDPTRLGYRMRIDDAEAWTILSQPFVRLAGMRSGKHRLELGASADGAAWSDRSAIVDFEVLRAWYARPLPIAAMAAALGCALYAAYRFRLANVVRLERQRARIAMDLHDEMGSGLGSIEILAEIARSGEVPKPEREAMLARIGASADELGASLSDIVWSLRSESAGLDAFASWLAERARRSFPGDQPALRLDFPHEWPAGTLSHVLRRELQKIALEALHNVAKHANARTVALSLKSEGARWTLAVEDDGTGMPEDPSSQGGLGLASMRARAEAINATVRWCRAATGGTRVEVRFDPREGRGRIGM